MARVSIIFGYLVSICVLACLLTYPLYLITGAELDRIVSRTILVNAVILFYPLCLLLKIPNLASLGFSTSHIFSTLSKSVGTGIAMLAPISFYFVYCGYRFWESSENSFLTLISTIVAALISGLLIGIIEETLFRGVIQSQLSKAINVIWAILIVNILYASAHFLEASDMVLSSQTHWYSGFIILNDAFSNLANFEQFSDAWLALLLAGIFLSIVKIRSNNLWWCIGIHAGWVMHIKLIKEFTARNIDASCSSLASDYDKFIGELSAVWILVILICWFIFFNKKNA